MVKLGQLLYCQEVDPRSAVGVRVPSRQGQQDPWDAGNAALGLVGCMDAGVTGMCCSQPGIGIPVGFLQSNVSLTSAQASQDAEALIWQLHFSFYSTQPKKKPKICRAQVS